MFRLILTCIAIILLNCSCHTNKSKPSSNALYFDSVIARADRLYDAGDKKGCIAYVISEHKRAKDLTIEDDMI